MHNPHPRRRAIEAHVRRLRHSRDKGVVVALTALLLLPLMAITGFAVDVGAWYARATQMQRAADAAALAAVVWIEDSNPTKYRDVGLETAAKNGFVHDPPAMTVDVNKINGNQVQVTIIDYGQQYFSSVFMSDPRITRRATAEFVEPVPLGSPRNFLGTGRMGYSGTSGAYQPEGLTLSINMYCTSKVQGDRKASRYFNATGESCNGTFNNEWAQPYEYYIELPATRLYPTDVLIFEGGLNTCTRTGLPANTVFAADGNPGQGDACAARGQTTFELFRADDTPLDDTDNPSMQVPGSCSASNPGADGHKTFDDHNIADETNTTFFPAPQPFTNSVNGWFNLCRIPASAPGGRYILRVAGDVKGPGYEPRGSNNYGIVANRVGNSGLCDSRVEAGCPKVYAKDYLSIRGNDQPAGGSAYVVAQFFLAEVGSEHAGKTLKVDLWDPAEGGYRIRLLRPTALNGWSYVNFNWSSGTYANENNVGYVPVSSYNFNGRLLSLEVDLPTDYTTPAGNAWWKIEYQYTTGQVNDRTTWEVSVTGDPVHLVD